MSKVGEPAKGKSAVADTQRTPEGGSYESPKHHFGDGEMPEKCRKVDITDADKKKTTVAEERAKRYYETHKNSLTNIVTTNPFGQRHRRN